MILLYLCIATGCVCVCVRERQKEREERERQKERESVVFLHLCSHILSHTQTPRSKREIKQDHTLVIASASANSKYAPGSPIKLNPFCRVFSHFLWTILWHSFLMHPQKLLKDPAETICVLSGLFLNFYILLVCGILTPVSGGPK